VGGGNYSITSIFTLSTSISFSEILCPRIVPSQTNEMTLLLV
jgi:hypothetical protein